MLKNPITNILKGETRWLTQGNLKVRHKKLETKHSIYVNVKIKHKKLEIKHSTHVNVKIMQPNASET